MTSPAGTPAGSVTVTSDGSALGIVNLAKGQVTMTTSALSAGDHTIATSYSGDANTNFLASDATLTQTINSTMVQGVTDPDLNRLMSALSDIIRDSGGNKIIELDRTCATAGTYQGLSNIDKLTQSTQSNDGCLQFISSSDTQL